MKSSDIRKKRDNFRQERGHAYLLPASLVAAKDSTALFNVAGMQQLIPFLMGKSHVLGQRLYNIQGCVRTNDIDDIGDERHLSYFEMMGNWSLGDYFKQQSIIRSIEFLHGEMGIPLERIGATIFAGSEKHAIPRDILSENTLQEVGITHITALGFDEHDESDNFWIAGTEGPCGPCCEFYIDRGDERGQNDWHLGTNDRYTEVWNNVFMEFYKNKDGTLTKLPQQNVDTGMGLERLAMILQQTETIFETDIFTDSIHSIEAFLTSQFSAPIVYPPYHYTQKNIDEYQSTVTRSFRIITDHSRSAIVLLRDGVLPSNEGRGYVLRRLIRRMYYHIQKIGNENFARHHTAESLLDLFGPIVLSILGKANKNIIDSLIRECLQFQETIKKGQKIIEQSIQSAKISGNVLPGDIAFQAYDTYGIPVELLQEVASAQGVSVDIIAFIKALEQARTLSRSATKSTFSKGTDWSSYISDMQPTKYIGYQNMTDSSMKLLKDFDIDGQRVLVFDKTPFYAEGGGEISDRGMIILESGENVSIIDVKKSGGVYLHIVG